jgi:hypothetical protein
MNIPFLLKKMTNNLLRMGGTEEELKERELKAKQAYEEKCATQEGLKDLVQVSRVSFPC